MNVAQLAVLTMALLLCAWPPVSAQQELASLAPVIEKVSPGVVSITAGGSISGDATAESGVPGILGNLAGSMTFEFQSQASGVVVNADLGYVLTNNHVIENAKSIRVTLADGNTLDAELVGADPTTDLAVLKLAPSANEHLVQVPLGDSSKLRVGDYVLAIGSPFGLSQSATLGIVSGLGRSGLDLDQYQDFIQTDASINPGNSGGALVDMSGHVVGISSAIMGYGGSGLGVGFAIPINLAGQVLTELVAHGEVQRGVLGAEAQPLDDVLRQLSIFRGMEGLIVSDVAEGSAAEKAGLEVGDVISAVDGKSVTASGDLNKALGLRSVGSSVTLTAFRDQREFTAVAELQAARSENPTIVPPGSLLAGASLDFARAPRVVRGWVQGALVKSVEEDSRASRAGLRAGDLIVAVDGHNIATPADAIAATSNGKEQALVLLVRVGVPTFLALVGT